MHEKRVVHYSSVYGKKEFNEINKLNYLNNICQNKWEQGQRKLYCFKDVKANECGAWIENVFFVDINEYDKRN